MEQVKLTFIHFFLGIFVIGILLMTISFTDIMTINNDTIFCLSIFIIEFSIFLFGLSLYLKIEKISELFLGKIFINPGHIFIWTNITWLLIPFAFILDDIINQKMSNIDFYTTFFGYDLFLLIIVNFIVAIFYLNFDRDEQNIGFTLLNYFSIFLAFIFFLFFSLLIILLIFFDYPTIAICFMMLTIYLINIISKILKFKTN